MILQHARAYRIKRKFTETRTQPVEDIPGIIQTACFAAPLPAILTWHIRILEMR